jgi:hypothetical protein
MQRFPLGLAVAFSALLSGCASTEYGSQPNYELYKLADDENKMVIASAIRYLRRSVVSASSDWIKPGIYMPSEVERLLVGSCGDGGNVAAALMALKNDKIDGFEYVPKIRPFAELPQDLTYYEIRNRDERRGPEYRPPMTATEQPLQAQRCPAPAERSVCGIAASPTPSVIPTPAVKNLDYVVLIYESEAQRCERSGNAAIDLTRPTNHDTLTRAAIEQNMRRSADLASVTFRSDELPQLIRLLPSKYQDAPASNSGIPAVMQEEVQRVFAAVLANARKSFKERKVPDSKLIFGENKASERQNQNLASWLRKLIPASENQVFLSPALVLSPFYLCYNTGASQYVTTRYNLIVQLLSNGDTPWRYLSRDHVARLAETQVQNEAMYKRCLVEQFYFVMSREIAHLIEKNDGSTDIAIEARADCFALINTRRNTKFDLGIFPLLPELGAPASSTDVFAKRRKILEQLDAHLSNISLPATGEETMQYCRQWANDRAALVAQQDN